MNEYDDYELEELLASPAWLAYVAACEGSLIEQPEHEFE